MLHKTNTLLVDRPASMQSHACSGTIRLQMHGFILQLIILSYIAHEHTLRGIWNFQKRSPFTGKCFLPILSRELFLKIDKMRCVLFFLSAGMTSLKCINHKFIRICKCECPLSQNHN